MSHCTLSLHILLWFPGEFPEFIFSLVGHPICDIGNHLQDMYDVTNQWVTVCNVR